MPSSSRRDDYITGFLQAAVTGEEDEIHQYIKDGIDVNEMQEYDEIGKKVSALMLASENSHSDCVETLLRFGANISQLTQYYTRAIVYASSQNRPECLRTLAAAGMYGSERCDGVMLKYKELAELAEQGNFVKIKNLIMNSDLSKQIGADGLWVNTLCFLILSGCPKDYIGDVLDNFQMDINDCSRRGFTPLTSAVLVGDVEMIDFLIRKGANVNKVDDFINNAEDIEFKWIESLVPFTGSESKKAVDSYLPFSSILNSDSKSPLMYAVWTGKLDVVKRLLLEKDLDIGHSDSQCRSVLAHAVYGGRVDVIDEILLHGVNVNGKHSDKGRTALFVAVEVESEEILKRVINAGADLKSVDGFGMTVIMYAAENGKVKSLEFLLEIDSLDMSFVDSVLPQYTALMYAAHNKHFDCVKLLLDHGANMDVRNVNGRSVLDVAAEFGDASCVQVLIEGSQKYGSSNHEHELRMGKAIHPAAKNKNIEVLKLIVPFCKNINAMDDSDLTALMHATNAGHIENINLLLKNGADVNVQNDEGVTAIWLALYAENWDCFELYIEAGADVNYVPEDCDMLMVCAAEMDDIDYLQILIEKGARHVNTLCSCSGKTPLIAAVKDHRLENVQLLLDNGADVNIPDKKGQTAAMHAAPWPEGLALLMKAGADLDAVDEYEDTLWFSAMRNRESLKMLLEDGSVFDKGREYRKLKLVHKDSGITIPYSWDVNSLMLLFQYGVFEWDWYVYGEQINEIDKIAFAALNVANNSPTQFKDRDERTTSLLLEAFLGNNIRTVRYLMANLFLTMEDYKTLVSGSDFHKRMRDLAENEEDGSPETLSYFNQVSCQPWRLETLSFLAISSSLNSSSLSSYKPTPSRSDQVETLALPEVLKSKLKFENAVRKLCPGEWESIGVLSSGEEEDLVAVIRPLYPREQDLTKCDECMLCYGHGFCL